MIVLTKCTEYFCTKADKKVSVLLTLRTVLYCVVMYYHYSSLLIYLKNKGQYTMNITNNLIVIIIVFITQSFQRSIAAMNLSRKPFHFVMQ
jgi:hypothetical protein